MTCNGYFAASRVNLQWSGILVYFYFFVFIWAWKSQFYLCISTLKIFLVNSDIFCDTKTQHSIWKYALPILVTTAVTTQTPFKQILTAKIDIMISKWTRFEVDCHIFSFSYFRVCMQAKDSVVVSRIWKKVKKFQLYKSVLSDLHI